jgi:hypothetical protein
MRKLVIFFPLFLMLSVSLPSIAQDKGIVKSDISNSPPVPDSSGNAFFSPLSGLEFLLSLAVLVFGLLLILIEILLIKEKHIKSVDIIKFITITLIITATLFLITAGYSNKQIAPAVGLMGTIAGYLLGRMQQSDLKSKNDEIPV